MMLSLDFRETRNMASRNSGPPAAPVPAVSSLLGEGSALAVGVSPSSASGWGAMGTSPSSSSTSPLSAGGALTAAVSSGAELTAGAADSAASGAAEGAAPSSWPSRLKLPASVEGDGEAGAAELWGSSPPKTDRS
ncbi:hypothetical protein CE91St43_28080 [Oscillospiraceae bacterium]|nr:hypothetical protein CE91St43_28080 [Oscillospiraceae bacterium]